MSLHYSFPIERYAEAPATARNPGSGRLRVLKARDPAMAAVAKRIHASDAFGFEAACKAVDDATAKVKARK